MTSAEATTARWYRNIARRMAAVGGTAEVTLTGSTRVDYTRVILAAGDAAWMIHHGLVEMDPTNPSIVRVREKEVQDG